MPSTHRVVGNSQIAPPRVTEGGKGEEEGRGGGEGRGGEGVPWFVFGLRFWVSSFFLSSGAFFLVLRVFLV